MPRECLNIIDVQVQSRQTRAKAVVAEEQSFVFCSSSAPAPVKAVELSCVTCGWCPFSQNCRHSWQRYRRQHFWYVSQEAAANYNQ
ncbi:hypothetical protein Tco_1499955 [Tanacetum coccineum]